MAQQWLGPTTAQALIDMIADAEALDNAQAFIEFYSAELSGSDSLIVTFSPQRKAVFTPIGPKIPRTSDGEPAWEQVRRLMLSDVQEC